MEEKKNKKENKEVKKLSYEQLEEVANQLMQQTQQYKEALMRMNNEVMFKRLDYLFRVVEHSEHFSIDFYNNCVAEIEQAISIDKEEVEKESKED